MNGTLWEIRFWVWNPTRGEYERDAENYLTYRDARIANEMYEAFTPTDSNPQIELWKTVMEKTADGGIEKLTERVAFKDATGNHPADEE